MKKGSVHARGFRHIRPSASRYRLIKNAFAGPKRFWGFAEMGSLDTMREYDFVFSFVLHSIGKHPKGIWPDYERYSVVSLHFVLVRLLMLAAIICSTNGQLFVLLMGSRVGAVVRALAFHQCVPGSIPRPGVICGLSLFI